MKKVYTHRPIICHNEVTGFSQNREGYFVIGEDGWGDLDYFRATPPFYRDSRNTLRQPSSIKPTCILHKSSCPTIILSSSFARTLLIMLPITILLCIVTAYATIKEYEFVYTNIYQQQEEDVA